MFQGGNGALQSGSVETYEGVMSFFFFEFC
jgi:hypothetical protein